MAILSRIDGKYMEEKLKRGYGTSNFLKNLNITEEEFFNYLKKTSLLKLTLPCVSE